MIEDHKSFIEKVLLPVLRNKNGTSKKTSFISKEEENLIKMLNGEFTQNTSSTNQRISTMVKNSDVNC